MDDVFFLVFFLCFFFVRFACSSPFGLSSLGVSPFFFVLIVFFYCGLSLCLCVVCVVDFCVRVGWFFYGVCEGSKVFLYFFFCGLLFGWSFLVFLFFFVFFVFFFFGLCFFVFVVFFLSFPLFWLRFWVLPLFSFIFLFFSVLFFLFLFLMFFFFSLSPSTLGATCLSHFLSQIVPFCGTSFKRMPTFSQPAATLPELVPSF